MDDANQVGDWQGSIMSQYEKGKAKQDTEERYQHSMKLPSSSPRISPYFWLEYVAEAEFLWKAEYEVLESALQTMLTRIDVDQNAIVGPMSV